MRELERDPADHPERAVSAGAGGLALEIGHAIARVVAVLGINERIGSNWVAKEQAARGVLNRALTEVPVELTRRLQHRPLL